MKGKLIVIDGADGSGKATQTKLLADRLKADGYKVETFSFPNYESNLVGNLIGECLRGDHGDFMNLSPKIASVLYAADRHETRDQIIKAINNCNYVIMDRYVSANQIHQGGKIADDTERKDFLNWLENLEFEVFKMPKPDLVFYLEVPLQVSQKLLQNGDAQEQKSYQGDKSDQSETNIAHQESARRSAVEIAKDYNNWLKIECAPDEELLSIKEINDLLHVQVTELR